MIIDTKYFDDEKEKGNIRTKELYCHKHNLMQTASGYGRRLATPYMWFNGKRWQRIYLCQISNAGTCYALHGKDWIVFN